MSAAHAVLVESPVYFEVPSTAPLADETIGNLVHDLRQPLSSIEAIAYYLEMTLPAEQLQARQYMRKLQQLVDQADTILDRATSSVRKPPALAKSAGAA
jgi:phosphoglycerate-specific signal transduction histidine kinase